MLLALRKLREQGVDACLCMVGDGPDRDALERRAYDLGIVRRTCFSSGIRKRWRRTTRPSTRSILPSANEGTPVSAIEALAAAKPVVATRVGGVPDVVREGIDGFLVEPGDIEAMADRLARLAGDPELRRGWANQAASGSTPATPSTACSTTSTSSTGPCSSSVGADSRPSAPVAGRP